jgi:hypothetical protein
LALIRPLTNLKSSRSGLKRCGTCGPADEAADRGQRLRATAVVIRLDAGTITQLETALTGRYTDPATALVRQYRDGRCHQGRLDKRPISPIRTPLNFALSAAPHTSHFRPSQPLSFGPRDSKTPRGHCGARGVLRSARRCRITSLLLLSWQEPSSLERQLPSSLEQLLPSWLEQLWQRLWLEL